MKLIVHNPEIGRLLRKEYTLEDLRKIEFLLKKNGCFEFKSFKNGLFPAASLKKEAKYTGYNNVWIRDTVHVANALYLNGEKTRALKTIRTLTKYLLKYKWKMEDSLAGKLDHRFRMNRPHIRFDAKKLQEIQVIWGHKENDALGIFVWLFCRIHNHAGTSPCAKEKTLLTLLALYFNHIKYWQDEDSGHWEEDEKIEASSIAIVTGGLRELKALFEREGGKGFSCVAGELKGRFLDTIITKGLGALKKILPWECRQTDPKKKRRYDAALLFSIWPVRVIEGKMAATILKGVAKNLQGAVGIRRYLMDSYWCADYKDKVREELRCSELNDLHVRNTLAAKKTEAQWCIFDPIMSIAYGQKYESTGNKKALELQTYYLNRSLAQITGKNCSYGAFKCPELYFFENGKLVVNDNVPLLWTQANLLMALKVMKESLVKNFKSTLG